MTPIGICRSVKAKLNAEMAPAPSPDASVVATTNVIWLAPIPIARGTIKAIARRAGVSEGALFSRYSSKLELFRDAIARQVAIGVRANTEANDIIRAKHGWGIADAVMFREFMRPSRAHQRAITLEGVRVSWHYPDVMSATMAELDEFLAQEMAADPTRRAESYHLGYAQGTGILVLPLVLESCYELPFDVVSVPDLG